MSRIFKTLYSDRTDLLYDGSQLRAHFIYETFDYLGNAIVAFEGPANVDLNHMVDLEDVKKESPIYSPLMLHFLGEWFEDSLDKAILYQHHFAGIIYERLLELGHKDLKRQGNDLFYQNRKLSVSIATATPTSVLIHVGINIQTDGTPIPTAGLSELNLVASKLAKDCLARFASDYETWDRARMKVKPR